MCNALQQRGLPNIVAFWSFIPLEYLYDGILTYPEPLTPLRTRTSPSLTVCDPLHNASSVAVATCKALDFQHGGHIGKMKRSAELCPFIFKFNEFKGLT
jgi:hypothetical protein